VRTIPPTRRPRARRFLAAAEFRRRDRTAPWVLAGVWLDQTRFQPARPGVEPVTRRLPDTGLLGWSEPFPIIAPDEDAAAQAALAAARGRWPEADRRSVPFASRP
jgi:hypothetical protein